MKNGLRLIFYFSFIFFVCFLCGTSSIKAADCGDTVAGLRITCDYTNSLSDIPSEIRDIITRYNQIDINTYKYQGNGYDFNHYGPNITVNMNERAVNWSAAQVNATKTAAKTVAAAEKYISISGTLMGSGNLEQQVMNGTEDLDEYSTANISTSPTYNVNFLYAAGSGYENISPYNQVMTTIYVRGANSIIFQDKYEKMAYNTGYVYKTCKAQFIICWSWSEDKVQEVYSRQNSVGSYDETNGKLTYKDLSSVQMIMPAAHIKHEFMEDDYWSGTYTRRVNGKTYYDFNLGYSTGIYWKENTLKRGVAGYTDSRDNFLLMTQAFFNYLVMKYTATVSFYYRDDAASTDSVVVLKKATLPVTIFVVYQGTTGKKNVMVSLNGFNDQSSKLGSVSLVPVQYDLSMILNPSYWDVSKLTHTGETISVAAGKLSSYQTKKLGNYTIYMNTVGINSNGIDITAMGVYRESNINAVSLFTSGKIYYDYDEVDFVDFSFTYQIGGGVINDLTPYLSSYLSNAGVCEKCGSPVNGTPLKANQLSIKVTARSNEEVEVKVYATTSASEIRSFIGSEKYLNYNYVTQGKRNSVEYTTSMSESKLIVFQILYYGATYYVPFTFDNIAPEINSFGNDRVNGKYIVVESEEELENLVFEATDDVSNVVSQVPEKSSLSNNGSGYKYTLTITDESGNETFMVYDVIIDSQAPTSVEGSAVLPGEKVSLSSYGNSFAEFQVNSNIKLNRGGDSAADYLDSYFDVNLNNISSLYDLSTLEPYNAVIENEGDSVSLDVLIKDYGVYGYTSAGLRGLYAKVWLDSDDESAIGWQFLSHGVYNTIESTYNIPLTSGINYIALVSLDYMNHLYKQDGLDNNFSFSVKIYAITVYGTPYISEIIATEDGFGAIVRDDLSIFKSTGITTVISEYVIVDSTESDLTFDNYPSSKLAVKSILDESSHDMIIATPDEEEFTNVVSKNKNFNNLYQYISLFEEGPGWVKYSSLELSSTLITALRTKDLHLSTMDNQMLIRGLLLNGQAYIYAHVVVISGSDVVDMYQRVLFANNYVKSNSPTLELTNSFTDENTGNLDNIFSVSGDDEVSYWNGNNMMIKYQLNMYKQSNLEARTGDDSQDIYIDDNFIIYYKSCYQSEGTFGAATVCAGSTIRYHQGYDINLGKMNSNYLYKVYVGVVTALEYNVQTNQLIEKYNNDSGYNVVTFASSKFMVNNDTSMNQTQLVETYYETYYGMFLYDTSIPEVIIEYTTINEYNPDGINKLKDVNYAAELGDMENFIIKVTIKYESDKYRKTAYWTRLDKDSIYWFPYYYSTGRSVCGNVDRIDCGYDKAFTTFGLEEALSNSRSTYDPEVGLVYYLQYPTSDDIAKISASYSVDVFDLIVKLTTTNGLHNDGMDLVVDEVVRKQNEEYLTIYYDQDGPKIMITSSPDKDSTYYAISISAEDVSSNVARVAFYYGKYDVDNPDAEAFLMYEEVVNAKIFTGYSAQLTQKGWYTVVAEDEFGQLSTFSFEVVQVGDGVMYSPTLDDTDQIQNNDDEAVKIVVTLVASIVSLLVAALIIALIVGLVVIYFKYGKYIKQIDKLKKSKMGQTAIKVAKKSGHPVAAGVATAVEKAPTEMFNDEDPQPAESPEESPQDSEEEIPSEDDE